MKPFLFTKKILLIIAALFLSGPMTYGAVRLPKFISDGMVLQRERPVTVWGWADAGENITLSLKGRAYTTIADDYGNWQIDLPPHEAGGPYTITVNELTIANVLFGEVWLASGQSNIELPMKRTADLYGDEIATAENPNIRYYKTPLTYKFDSPADDFEGGEWVEVNRQTIGDIGAAVYFFSKKLYEEYGVPVGVINSSVGGSPIQAWISAEGLSEFPDELAVTERLKDPAVVAKISETDGRNTREWFETLNALDKGVGRWHRTDTDYSHWRTLTLPGYWADKEPGQINGSIWVTRQVDIPADMAAGDAVLRLGCIVDSDSAYVNGVFVGTISYQYPPRIYPIPAGVLKEGTNRVTVRMISNGGRGGVVPDKTFCITDGRNSIPLEGEWQYRIGAIMPPMKPTTTFQYTPTGLYNAMIHPLARYAFRGAAWYQGESNTDRPQQYSKLLPALIRDWRGLWGEELPFVLVQLPNFMEARPYPSDDNWADFREVQRRSLAVAGTALAVTIDAGEWNDIHPLNKATVGERMALAAMRVAYGETEKVTSGPMYSSMRVDGNRIIITFTDTGSGLWSDGPLGGFAIAGSDGIFVWADAAIDGDTVTVWNDAVDEPVTVRYGWAANPVTANLRNREGLPASPFTTAQ